MGWPFKKQREVVDLTYLAKRGLIKMPTQKTNDYKEIPVTQSNSSSNDFGFLGAMASSAEPSPTNSPVPAGMNNKIDDLDYKLDAISKRVNAMLDRLDLVEKKIDRAGRQGALD